MLHLGSSHSSQFLKAIARFLCWFLIGKPVIVCVCGNLKPPTLSSLNSLYVWFLMFGAQQESPRCTVQLAPCCFMNMLISRANQCMTVVFSSSLILLLGPKGKWNGLAVRLIYPMFDWKGLNLPGKGPFVGTSASK